MISFKEALKIHSSIPLKPLEIEVISLFVKYRARFSRGYYLHSRLA